MINTESVKESRFGYRSWTHYSGIVRPRQTPFRNPWVRKTCQSLVAKDMIKKDRNVRADPLLHARSGSDQRGNGETKHTNDEHSPVAIAIP